MMLLLMLRCRCVRFTIPSLSIRVLLFFYPFFPSCCLYYYSYHKTNIHDHPPHPFDRIYQFVSLLCCTGFLFSLFTWSSDLVRVLLCSTMSINPSLYCVVQDLLLSLSLRGVLCVSDRVVPDLFLSLYFLFFVRPYLSIRFFIVSYWIFSSLFICRSNLVLVLLLSPTPTLSSVVGSIINN